METTTDTAFKVMNQDFVKLDKFDGTNFTRWQDKMKFLLTALKIFYILSPDLEFIPEPTDGETDAIKEARRKREEDELVCRGHILNTLSDRLYDLFTSIKSPRKIWKALEDKYESEKQGTDKFLIMKYFQFSMVDNLPVLDQVHDLQVLVSKLRDVKIKLHESLQVGAIIAKLPSSWRNYQKKLLHSSEDFTLEQLQKYLRIGDETRVLKMNEEVQASTSKVNMMNEKKPNYKKGNGGNKRKNPGSNNYNGSNKKFKTKETRSCHHCSKVGHLIRDCRIKKREMQLAATNNGNNAIRANANIVENNEVENLVAMVSAMHIGMVTELNMAETTQSIDWWMKTKASQQNRLLRIITIPIRALCKARDLYVKSMNNYADRMNCGNVMAVPGKSQVAGLPKSFSVNSSRAYDNEDFRELVRARTTSDRLSLESYMKHQMKMRAGRGPRAMPPRSSSVAMGRIDEDRPCCYFGEDYNYNSSINNVSARIGNDQLMKYPRSKSHAVAARR
ncbi:hypothetical protein BUALT_Bualt08G0045000 [Buddleja alternifolia]|uniref:CCHC-type domain-containing protein n=1 Tax=Buddleja alternifolia TaxID=168488 RepID=A0AAV6XC61_9LAMI|nr:hypothetical protein BUALT_Bualt08G0045000 [Buddleja alternifolia]